MTTKALREDYEVPAGMRRVCRRFERWRKGHKARLPIPEGLWASAAQAAREHGVFRTAKVLRLEYGKLKRMVESAPPSPRRSRCALWVQQRFWNWCHPRGCPLGPACRSAWLSWRDHGARCASSGKEPLHRTWPV